MLDRCDQGHCSHWYLRPPRGGDHRGGAGCEDFFSNLLAIKIYKTKPFRSEQELGLNCLRGLVRVSGVRHVFVDLVADRHHAVNSIEETVSPATPSSMIQSATDNASLSVKRRS
jgi:hypothetical protein